MNENLAHRRGLILGAPSLLALAAGLSAARAHAQPGGATLDPWSNFADLVSQLGNEIPNSGVPPTDVDRAEGYRLLSRYLAIGFDFCVEYNEPAYPAFFHGTRDGVRKYAGDNPDELYDHAWVSPEYAYRVTGNMRGVELIECGIYTGDAFIDPVAHPVRMQAHITEETLKRDVDGSFELYLGGAQRAENWLPMQPGATSFTIRRYRRSPTTNYDPLNIERLGGDAFPPQLTSAGIGERLALAVKWAQSNTRIWAKYVDRVRTLKRNVLVAFDETGLLGTPGGHKYLEGYWDVPAGKALRLSFVPPKCAYWNIVICNYWMETLDWRFGAGVNFNNFNTTLDSKGVATFVISEKPPKRGNVNWLSTQQHNAGMMALRAARLLGPMPVVKAELISAKDV